MLMKNKSSYKIVFDNLLLFDGISITTGLQHSIALTNPIELTGLTELKNAIISHMGRINNDAIFSYFDSVINKSKVSVPSYPMMDVPINVINGIKNQSNGPYPNVINKYKNKGAFENYLKDLENSAHNFHEIINETNGEIIITNCLVIFNNNVYLPAHITFPFVEHNGKYVLPVSHDKSVFTIYCTMVFKKEKYIG